MLGEHTSQNALPPNPIFLETAMVFGSRSIAAWQVPHVELAGPGLRDRGAMMVAYEPE
jgi:hypothetical protein